LKTGYLIEILSAVNLAAADKGGTSDPFIRCHIKGKKLKTIFRTPHIDKNLNPAWTYDIYIYFNKFLCL